MALVRYHVTNALHSLNLGVAGRSLQVLYGANLAQVDPQYRKRKLQSAVVPLHSIANKALRMEACFS